MIRRLYVHNFRCLQNFELPTSGSGTTSLLLIGRNGSGKTTVGVALEILQRIARGTNRVRDLVEPKDFFRGDSDVPMRFEIDVALGGELYAYKLALEFPKGFKELRVLEENLSVSGKPVLTREMAQVRLAKAGRGKEATFGIDWHLVALPIVQTPEEPVSTFKQWLARMLILRPMPALILGDSKHETLEPNPQVTDFGAWFSGLLAHAPASYAEIDAYLKQLMPDLKDIKNPEVGSDSRSIIIQFSNGERSHRVPFADLSDGEKCFMICALVLAASKVHDNLVCFWDEPDSHLALEEVGDFILALRQAFHSGAQFIATSHNEEAIRRFSNENTVLLHRRSHLEPTTARILDSLQIRGDLISALLRGDVEP